MLQFQNSGMVSDGKVNILGVLSKSKFLTKSIFLYDRNSKTNHCKYLSRNDNDLSSNELKYFLSYSDSKIIRILKHNFFLLAFEVQILTKICQNHINICKLYVADKSSPFRIVFPFSYTMIPIIGFKFNTSIIVTYYIAERYSLNHSFFLLWCPRTAFTHFQLTTKSLCVYVSTCVCRYIHKRVVIQIVCATTTIFDLLHYY
ncbi:hypothetical protein AGLY_000586 [Aphis glycines]|uniref:Uncharacterized protein n=1 Tax=Aphis glycines TaxID=307491 RepID=A0A6G0U7W6_APHGL|nr:hypothetical protein AGLY_000586 [Aphis glycines]